MTDSCLFCRLAAGEIPAKIVAETETALAFRDVNPQAPVHVLVIPKRHVESLNDASDVGELGALLSLAARVARDEGIADSGYRTVINTNADGGQAVFHLHVHVLGGRKLTWPPG